MSQTNESLTTVSNTFDIKLSQQSLKKSWDLPISSDVIIDIIQYNELSLLKLLSLNKSIREILLKKLTSGELKVENLVLKFREMKYIPEYATSSFWIKILARENTDDLKKLEHLGKYLRIFKKLMYCGPNSNSDWKKYSMRTEKYTWDNVDPEKLIKYFTNITHLQVFGVINSGSIDFSDFCNLKYISTTCNSLILRPYDMTNVNTFIDTTDEIVNYYSNEYYYNDVFENVNFEDLENVEHLRYSNKTMIIDYMRMLKKVKYCDLSGCRSLSADYVKFVPNVETLVVYDNAFPGNKLNSLKHLKELIVLSDEYYLGNINFSCDNYDWIKNIVSLKIESKKSIHQLYSTIYNHNLKTSRKVSFKKLQKIDARLIEYLITLETMTILEDSVIFPSLKAIIAKKKDKYDDYELKIKDELEKKSIFIIFN